MDLSQGDFLKEPTVWVLLVWVLSFTLCYCCRFFNTPTTHTSHLLDKEDDYEVDDDEAFNFSETVRSFSLR